MILNWCLIDYHPPRPTTTTTTYHPPPPTTTYYHLLPPPRFARRSANDLKINLKMLSKSFKIYSKIDSKSIQKLIQNRLKNWVKIDLVWAPVGGQSGGLLRDLKNAPLCSGITTFGNLGSIWTGSALKMVNLEYRGEAWNEHSLNILQTIRYAS